MADHAFQPVIAGAPRGRPTRIVGRYFALARVAIKLSQRQFVTIVGPGGMGKSSLARAYAADLSAGYPGGVFLVNVGALGSAEMLPAAVLTSLGLSTDQADPLLAACNFLINRQALVVLDGCEHLLLATAATAERLRAGSTAVSILATSREALRADGEWAYRLPAMTLPSTRVVATREEAESFTAVQLFVDRATHADPGFQFTDAQAQAVCDICRCLDGIPLALELAAARVFHLGLDGVAAQIGDRLGWRDDDAHSPEPRHRTLGATLDWSHELCSNVERVVLRRLSIFCDAFDMRAATSVVGDEKLPAEQVVDGLMGLLAKSLLVVMEGPEDERFRLLDTTREYAFKKLQASADGSETSRRHAQFMLKIAAEAEANWNTVQPVAWMKTYSPWLDDIGHALDWNLAKADNPSAAVTLAVSGFNMTRQMGVEIEFKPRIDAALAMLRGLQPRQPLLELHLNKCINSFVHVARAVANAQVNSLREALEVPEQDSTELRATTVASGIAMMAGLFGAAGFLADYPRMNEWFSRIDDLARSSGDPMALLTADRIRAQILHWGGAHAMAVRVARRILDGTCFRIPFSYNPSPINLRVSMRIVLARSLWIQGFSVRSRQVVAEAMRCALDDSPLSQCQVIAQAALPIALWSGEDAHVDGLVAQLKERATQCSIGNWNLWACEYAAVAAQRRPQSNQTDVCTPFGQIQDAQLIDHLCTLLPRCVTAAHVDRVVAGQAGWCAPEILRAYAINLLAGQHSQLARDNAESLLRQSLGQANIQGALAWELKTSVSLSMLLNSTGRTEEAIALLSGIVARFKEGFDTLDFLDAKRMLVELRSSGTFRQRA